MNVWSCLVTRFGVCRLLFSTGIAGTGSHRSFDDIGYEMEDECVVMEIEKPRGNDCDKL